MCYSPPTSLARMATTTHLSVYQLHLLPVPEPRNVQASWVHRTFASPDTPGARELTSV